MSTAETKATTDSELGEESRRMETQEINEMLEAEGDRGQEILAAMFPRGTDVQPMLDAVRQQTPMGVARAPLPFVREGKVDKAQLAAFNTQFAERLAAPVTVEAAASVHFQTNEDWNGYVTKGAYDFITGEAVTKPLRAVLHNPSSDMTVSLRPGQDPAIQPLKMALFADFANGNHVSREVARRVVEGAYPYAFHLGDVYYDGNEREFREYFEEPMAPLLKTTELFTLAGNHEMYSKGVHFQKYVMNKASRQPGFQRQNAEMFRLRGKGVQIIGLDTMWCHWAGKLFRGNAPRLDAPTRALLEEWLTEGDPDGINILMSSNEPFSTECSGVTRMLDDLAPFLGRGLVDLWIWGNVHHAAVFDTYTVPNSTEHGFVGACVGHGGYPFYTQGAPKQTSGVTCRWSERRHRFWPHAGVRPDVGLNGWAELAISRDAQGWTTTMTYRDWVGRDRARATVRKLRGAGPQVVSMEENYASDPGGEDWRSAT